MESGSRLDNVMDALGHEYRRDLLLAMREKNPQTVAEPPGSAATPAQEAASSVADSALMRHHSHLPKLEDYGFIERDEEAEEIVKGPNWDEIEPFLTMLADAPADSSVETP